MILKPQHWATSLNVTQNNIHLMKHFLKTLFIQKTHFMWLFSFNSSLCLKSHIQLSFFFFKRSQHWSKWKSYGLTNHSTEKLIYQCLNASKQHHFKQVYKVLLLRVITLMSHIWEKQKKTTHYESLCVSKITTKGPYCSKKKKKITPH